MITSSISGEIIKIVVRVGLKGDKGEPGIVTPDLQELADDMLAIKLEVESQVGLSVKSFGAIGNWVADDTNAFIQAEASGRSFNIPEGYYRVTRDFNLYKASGLGVVINSTTRKRLIFSQLENKNQIIPTYGSNIDCGNYDGARSQSNLDYIIANLNTIPYRPIAVCLHLTFNPSGDLIVTQFDASNKGHSEANFDTFFNKLIASGMKIWAIKIHNRHKIEVPAGVSDFPKYITQLSAQIGRIGDKFAGIVENITIINETPYLTAATEYFSAISSIITSLKDKDYKVGMTYVNPEEVIASLYNDQLDIIGFNLYPHVGLNQLKTTRYESVAAWKRMLPVVKAFKIKYPDKVIAITETGSSDKIDSLLRPGLPGSSFPPGTLDNEGKIIAIYWEGVLNALSKADYIDYFFGWDFQESYTVFGFPFSKLMMLKYLK